MFVMDLLNIMITKFLKSTNDALLLYIICITMFNNVLFNFLFQARHSTIQYNICVENPLITVRLW